MKKAQKLSPNPSPAKTPPRRKPEADATILARMVEGPVPYLEVTVRERVTEASLAGVFERVRGEIFRCQAKRLLVDVRGGSVALTISDMFGLAKMVTATFAGVLERFALLLRPQDVLPEKFFEPSVNHRGLPTFVTTDSEEAAYWIAAKFRLGR